MEATDRHGQTPLNLAARHGYADVVRVLLAAGACADHADCDGWTALRAAAWGGHTQVIVYIHVYKTISRNKRKYCSFKTPKQPNVSQVFVIFK